MYNYFFYITVIAISHLKYAYNNQTVFQTHWYAVALICIVNPAVLNSVSI